MEWKSFQVLSSSSYKILSPQAWEAQKWVRKITTVCKRGSAGKKCHPSITSNSFLNLEAKGMQNSALLLQTE